MTLKKIVKTDGIQIEAMSLPESIDVTKRKRGFLLFMNLVNFEKDEQAVRQRFAETGLDYKIMIVDGLTHSQRPKAVKQGVETLMKEVELLKLEVSRLKESQSPSVEEKIALKAEL
jgi:ABC-type phosphate transport system auxiliary subunit